jgi:hypothetical protein
MTETRTVKPAAGASRSRRVGWRGEWVQQGEVGVPKVGVEAPAVNVVGFARDDIEERRHHVFGLDEAGARPLRLIVRISSAMPGVSTPAPGLTILIVRPVPSTSFAHTSVAISSAAFEAP